MRYFKTSFKINPDMMCSKTVTIEARRYMPKHKRFFSEFKQWLFIRLTRSFLLEVTGRK